MKSQNTVIFSPLPTFEEYDLSQIEPIPFASAAPSCYETAASGEAGRIERDLILDAMDQVLEVADPYDLFERVGPFSPQSTPVNCSLNTDDCPDPRNEGELQTNERYTQEKAVEKATYQEGSPASCSENIISPQQSGKWNERYQELRQFRLEYGYCSVPSVWPQNPPLAQWVKRQRYQYKLKMTRGQHSTMTEERRKLLEELGFVWASHSVFWGERLNELHAFREKHGHCNVPTKYPEDPQLAVWAKCQRRQFKLFSSGSKLSNMTSERISKLAKIGFVFNPREFRRETALRI